MGKQKAKITEPDTDSIPKEKEEVQTIEQFKEESDSTSPLSNSDDFEDSQVKSRDIDQSLLNILDRWFQSYLRIITFMGTASGIILLYGGVNLIQVINDAEKDKEEKGKIELVNSATQPTSISDTSKATSTIAKPDSFPERVSLYNIIKKNKNSIKVGIVFLTISLLSTIVCVLTTYNWYISGVSNILKDARSEEYLERLIQDKLKYRNKEVIGNMWFWGQISLYSGWLTGVTLGIGVFTYAYGIWEIISELLHL